MKTQDLVGELALNLQPVDPRAASRQFALALGLAVVLSIAATLVLLGLRQDWADALPLPMFWLKLGFPAATAAAAFVVLRRLGHPGLRPGSAMLALLLPAAMVWLIGGWALMAAPASSRTGLLLGDSWWQCPPFITALAIPAFALAVSAMRRLAPTRLALAGAIAGLFAGSAAAFAYALYCEEMQAPFVAVWYSLGMLIPAGLGAALGRRLLHW